MAARRVPLLRDLGIQLFFNGPESFTPDDRYILGEAPGLRRLLRRRRLQLGRLPVRRRRRAGGGRLDRGRPPADGSVGGRHPAVHALPGQPALPARPDDRDARPALRHALAVPPGRDRARRAPDAVPRPRRGARRRASASWPAGSGRTGTRRAGVEPRYEYSYGRQNWFPHSAAEHRAVREGVGIFDQTSFGKILVQGRDAERCAQRAVRRGRRRRAGPDRLHPVAERAGRDRVRPHGHAPRTSDRSSWSRRGRPSSRDLDWLRRAASRPRPTCVATDVTNAYAVLGVMGPGRASCSRRSPTPTCRTRRFPFATSREIDLGYALRPRVAHHLRRRARLGAVHPDRRRDPRVRHDRRGRRARAASATPATTPSTRCGSRRRIGTGATT